jgi:hypothetical protein
MDWLTFFSKIIDSIAWPSTAILLVWLLKDNISQLFPFIEKLKYKDFEIAFSQSIKELTEESEAEIEEPTENDEFIYSNTKQKQDLYLLAKLSPRTAILESWLLVEMAAVEIIRNRGLVTHKKHMGPLTIGQHLHRAQVLTPEQFQIYNKLRNIRNQAVHISDTSFNLKEVTDYIDSALAMAYQLEKSILP